MIEHDKKPFKSMMTALTTLYGKKDLDQDLLRIWYGKLKRFDFDMVSKAFDTWVDNNKFMPLPVDIIDLCKAQEARVITKALPKPTHTPEQIKENQDRLNRELAKIKPKRDHKAWAKVIMAEPSSHLDIAVRFAKEALHLNLTDV
jgi:hypothetical protein